MHEQHVEQKERQPMSKADRLALRVALAEGKVCWIEWSPIDGKSKRDRFKLDANFNLYMLQDSGDWHLTGVGADRWLSWSEVREPRVWEFETYACGPFPKDLGDAINSGSHFKARYEEILEET